MPATQHRGKPGATDIFAGIDRRIVTLPAHVERHPIAIAPQTYPLMSILMRCRPLRHFTVHVYASRASLSSAAGGRSLQWEANKTPLPPSHGTPLRDCEHGRPLSTLSRAVKADAMSFRCAQATANYTFQSSTSSIAWDWFTKKHSTNVLKELMYCAQFLAFDS